MHCAPLRSLVWSRAARVAPSGSPGRLVASLARCLPHEPGPLRRVTRTPIRHRCTLSRANTPRFHTHPTSPALQKPSNTSFDAAVSAVPRFPPHHYTAACDHQPCLRTSGGATSVATNSLLKGFSRQPGGCWGDRLQDSRTSTPQQHQQMPAPVKAPVWREAAGSCHATQRISNPRLPVNTLRPAYRDQRCPPF